MSLSLVYTSPCTLRWIDAAPVSANLRSLRHLPKDGWSTAQFPNYLSSRIPVIGQLKNSQGSFHQNGAL